MTDDVPRFPGVYRRPDSNIYQFGLRVPADLRAHFPTPWAVRVSLATADVRDANSKAKALHVEWEGRFLALRRPKEAPLKASPALGLAGLRRALLMRIEAALPGIDERTAGLSAEVRQQRLGSAEWVLAAERAARDGGYLEDLGVERWIAELAPTREPVEVAEVQAAHVHLHEIFVEALQDTSRTFPLRVRLLSERRALLAVGRVQHTGEGDRSQGELLPQTSAHGHRIMDAFRVWAATPRPAKTVSKFRAHAQRFADLMGDPVLEGFAKRDALGFRGKLQDWAAREGKTAVTANNVLISVRAILTAARDEGWLEVNPLAGLAVKVGGVPEGGREPWTQRELSVLFSDPIWAAYQLPVQRKAGGPAAYWIPLIACYTGARVSEIAQLYTDDLDLGEGVEVMEFRARAERGQRLKNAGSWRAVPIHSELVRLGLGDYVASISPGPLFPELPKNGVNGPGGQFSDWFGSFKRAKGFTSPQKSFHSFRHLVATDLRVHGATEAQANAITGHAGEGVGGKVYAATIRQQAGRLRPVIELLNYPLLTLSRVYRDPAAG